MDANFLLGHLVRSWILSWGFERHEEAVAAAERAVELSRGHWIPVAHCGAVLARAGRRAEAETILSDLIERARSSYVDPVFFLALHLSLGELDRAFEQAQKACEQRDGFRWVAAAWYWAEALSAHPRYRELLPRGWVPRP